MYHTFILGLYDPCICTRNTRCMQTDYNNVDGTDYNNVDDAFIRYALPWANQCVRLRRTGGRRSTGVQSSGSVLEPKYRHQCTRGRAAAVPPVKGRLPLPVPPKREDTIMVVDFKTGTLTF